LLVIEFGARGEEIDMQSPASRRLKKEGLTTVGVYFAVFLCSFFVDMKIHATGVLLWSLAVLPVVPLVGVIVLFGRYLRDERDEFKRDVVVRCLLWGMAGCLAVDLLSDYLRIYGWTGEFPPFTSFWVFFVFMIAAKLSYRAKNRVPVDE
jgi:hypothetical protein